MSSGPDTCDAPAARVAVVGCGNWLQREDRVGPRILAHLAGRLGPDVAIEDVGVSGLGLLDRLHGQELVVLVDACLSGAPAGTVTVGEPAVDLPLTRPTSTHQVGPLESLAVVRELFPERLPRRIVLVQVETAGLDDEGERVACHRAAGSVEREIAAWRAGLARPSAVPAEVVTSGGRAR